MQAQVRNTEILRFAQNDLGGGNDLGEGNHVGGARSAAKLAAGAHEFEGMMLQQMLKGLEFGKAPGDGDDEAGGATGAMQSYGTEALAKSIASGGGFGIAQRIIQQVTAEASAHSHSGIGGKV